MDKILFTYMSLAATITMLPGGVTHNREWLVIFGGGGLMETAFPPEDMDDYIERRGFVLLGRIDEVLKWAEEENK